jgi:hypothetical protein
MSLFRLPPCLVALVVVDGPSCSKRPMMEDLLHGTLDVVLTLAL